MLWKFSFASGSTLDTLLSRETPPTVEELLDEQDILAECKAQNNKLVTYLSREESVKSLLSWITSGLDDLDAQAETAEQEAYARALVSPEAYPPYGKSAAPSPPAEKTEDEDDDTLPRLGGIGLGEGLGGPEESTSFDVQSQKYPQVATEILTSELWTIPETVMMHKESLLKPFWDSVLPPVDRRKEKSIHVRMERHRAHLQFWTEADEERERKSEVIRGMWMRVNASLLQKRTTEMVRFIQVQPNIIERMMVRIESPAVQDMLARIIQTEESVSDVMSWLASQELIPRLLALLSPEYPPSTHSIAAELIKGIISVSAPNSSFNPQGGNAMDQQTGGGSASHKDNRLVRQLTNRESINTLINFMFNTPELTDANWKGLSGDGPGTNPCDPFVIQPLPSVASATSSLSSLCNVIVEVIRRNNSDLAEPYLFNTMRNRLMAIQSESMRGVEVAPDEDVPDSDGEASRKQMEEVLPELTDKLAIVHLGNLVAALSDRFGDLHQLLLHPRSQDRVASTLTPKPLTMERFRIIELYAELLHSSNMATLNRVPGTGPEYNDDGALSGGLDGLDRLGQALQAGEAGEESPETETPADESQVASQARDQPVSSGSTDYSLESDDVPLSDDEDTPSPTSPQVTAVPPTLEVTVPPSPSLADAERLRDVMGIEGEAAAEPSETASHAAVATTTAAPSAASLDEDHQPPPVDEAHEPALVDEPLSTGERLKQRLIEYRVLPTLMDLFFEHANNNFLHHLVYDILQQILNGQLGRGYNRELIIDLFANAKLVDRVLAAQKLNDNLVASELHRPRLSYMGHISLIAEELVKFFARCPADLHELIKGTYPQESWDAFVDGSLRETRARDSQPLAGGKPLPGLGSGMTSTSERSDSESDDDDDGPGPTIGEPLSRTPAKQADSYGDGDEGDDQTMEQFWRPSNVRSGAMDSSDDDDDDDADWLRPAASRERGAEADDFGAFQSTTSSKTDDFDDDDAWGAYTSVSTGDNSGENPFGDAFAPTTSAAATSVDAFRSAEPLTPRDWAEAFDREFESSEPQPWAEDAEEVTAIVVPEDDSEGDTAGTPISSWSFPGNESDDLGEDLPPTSPDMDAVASRAAAINLTEEGSAAGSVPVATVVVAASAAAGRRRANSISQRKPLTPDEERDDVLADASTAAHPLGPGVDSHDTVLSHGMLERRMSDGTVVRVPEDDVARGIDEAMERRVDEDVEQDVAVEALVASVRGAGGEEAA